MATARDALSPPTMAFALIAAVKSSVYLRMMYTDEGSAYWLITKNVVHNVPEWLHIWTASIHDEVVVENWSDQTYQQNAGTRITEANSACALLPAARGGCCAAPRRTPAAASPPPRPSLICSLCRHIHHSGPAFPGRGAGHHGQFRNARNGRAQAVSRRIAALSIFVQSQ